ncbi:hypothetical protein M378DRAFT_174279 [Amanita muscaria Koide BX008]|uniref:Uncharacterized protein n=1 Tax=Amanita muscaria (strain Koide BX008) TaxID=946122 RepID=A0A0C2WCS0_AMAMK|nr:hypothetical protein M378DRAFT_174279 [Amanita muscaria Koide BX008]
MPEEHAGQLGSEYVWKELLARTRHAEFMTCNTSLFDAEIFKAVWKPVISAVAYAFVNFEDDYVIQHSIAGLRIGTLVLAANMNYASQTVSLAALDLPSTANITQVMNTGSSIN